MSDQNFNWGLGGCAEFILQPHVCGGLFKLGFEIDDSITEEIGVGLLLELIKASEAACFIVMFNREANLQLSHYHHLDLVYAA